MPTTTSPTITPDDKVVFLLSYLSNLVSYLTGPGLDYVLKGSVEAGLVKTGTPWQIVWGPAVLQYPADGYALNAMYVASPIGQPGRYVIAIAGTNIPSALDWFLEDFNVSTQVPWPASKADGSPAISMATASGLSILLTVTPSIGLAGAGLTLPQFLSLAAATSTAGIQVQTTGHSLGGALSPALALWLADHQGIKTGWDPQHTARVRSMPTAGATPGNLDFANYYDSRLGPSTRRFINSLDVIPHAWNLETLAELPPLFAPAIPSSSGIEVLVQEATKAAANGNYAPIVPDADPIAGTVNTSIINPAASAAANWVAQMGYQHTTAYYVAFGLPLQVIPVAPLAIPPPLHASKIVSTAPGRRMVAVGTSMVEVPDDGEGRQTLINDLSEVIASTDAVTNDDRKIA